MIISGVITLYFQAAKGQVLGEAAIVLGLLWFVGGFMFLVALGCGLPLKRVLNGNAPVFSVRVAPEVTRRIE